MAASTPSPAGLPPGRISRRQLLTAGGLGFLGLNLAQLLEAETLAGAAGGAKSPIKSCILMFYYGGPSHHDTWDMKPAAPLEVRGEFQSIATSVPGVRISEHLPRCAKILDRVAIIRSAHHGMRNHNAAAVEALCGRTPVKGDLELLANDPTTDFPCFGSALSYLAPRKSTVPSHVALPHVMYNVVKLPGQTAGFLGPAYEPLASGQRPEYGRLSRRRNPAPAGRHPGRIGKSPVAAVARQLAIDRPSTSRRRRRRMNAFLRAGFRPAALRRRAAQASTSTRRDRSSASATAATSTGKARCWRGGWSRPACDSSASTTR